MSRKENKVIYLEFKDYGKIGSSQLGRSEMKDVKIEMGKKR